MGIFERAFARYLIRYIVIEYCYHSFHAVVPDQTFRKMSRFRFLKIVPSTINQKSVAQENDLETNIFEFSTFYAKLLADLMLQDLWNE
jgi:hypothetical protein